MVVVLKVVRPIVRGGKQEERGQVDVWLRSLYHFDAGAWGSH